MLIHTISIIIYTCTVFLTVIKFLHKMGILIKYCHQEYFVQSAG